jgi:uncharacterized membrane protein
MLRSLVSFVILLLITTTTITTTTAVQAQEQTQQSPDEGSTSSPEVLGHNLENLITPYIEYLTFVIDVAAGIIIGISAIMALISFLRILRKPAEQQTRAKETIRLRLARGLLLALDFVVASDILKTIIVPSITELTILAVVVGIRIVLSWSLSKEIDRHADLKVDQIKSEGASQTTTMKSNETRIKKEKGEENSNNNISSEA